MDIAAAPDCDGDGAVAAALPPVEGIDEEPGAAEGEIDEGDGPGAPIGAPLILAQLLSGGVETPQADGSAVALVIFNAIPKLLLFLKASHKHLGLCFKTILKPEQQDPSGLETVLPFITKLRQSAMLRRTLEQSTEGEGAVEEGVVPFAKAHKARRLNTHKSFSIAKKRRPQKNWAPNGLMAPLIYVECSSLVGSRNGSMVPRWD